MPETHNLKVRVPFASGTGRRWLTTSLRDRRDSCGRHRGQRRILWLFSVISSGIMAGDTKYSRWSFLTSFHQYLVLNLGLFDIRGPQKDCRQRAPAAMEQTSWRETTGCFSSQEITTATKRNLSERNCTRESAWERVEAVKGEQDAGEQVPKRFVIWNKEWPRKRLSTLPKSKNMGTRTKTQIYRQVKEFVLVMWPVGRKPDSGSLQHRLSEICGG